MTKESLNAMRLTEEQAAKVMGELDGDFVTKSRFNEINKELQAAKSTIKERDKQLEELQNATGDVEAMKKQISELQTTNTTQQEKFEAEMKAVKIGNAVDAALKDAKAINPATVKPLLAAFLEKAELADDGTIQGLADEIGKLTKGEDTGFLFRTDTSAAPLVSGTAPAGSVTTPPDTKTTGYEARLADARKAGNSALAIAIKREAAADGVQLF